MTLSTFIEKTSQEFDEKFGIEENAGCDGCGACQRIHADTKSFLSSKLREVAEASFRRGWNDGNSYGSSYLDMTVSNEDAEIDLQAWLSNEKDGA